MPIYEYNCGDCGNEFEELVMRSSQRVSCPSCGNEEPKKAMSVFAYSSGGRIRAGGAGCGDCSKSSCTGCNCGCG